MIGGRADPFNEEGKLRVLENVQNTDLLPCKLEAIGAHAPTDAGFTAKPSLKRTHIINRDNPAHPASAILSAASDSSAKGRLLGRGMVEGRDDLDVAASGKGENKIARTERRVPTPIDEHRAEVGTDALDDVSDFGCGARVRDMV
jgi:hypothetical protein